MSAPESVTITLPTIFESWGQYARDLDRDGYPTLAAEIRRQARPKPEEPKGLGAVVLDRDGNRWVRVDPNPGDNVLGAWESEFSPTNKTHSDLDVVEVLSEGVTA